MPRQRSANRKTREKDGLLGLEKEKLAALLAEQIGTLPYHRQKEWAARHLPRSAETRSPTRSRPATLIREIERFCASSRSGAYVSWVDDDGWDGGDDAGGEEFEEWIALFTDFTKGALELTRWGRHREAVSAYRMLLELLREAGETTDVLGNHGAPEDALRLDLSKVIEAYTQSLLATGAPGGFDAVITEVLPVARKHRYAGGFIGLARALDAEGKERLRARLAKAIEAAPEARGFGSPDAAEGLIALARVERKAAEVLALKERFASRNAIYLKEVLEHYRRKKDWHGVARLAGMGLHHFGHHPEFTQALIRAREALGEHAAAQDAHFDNFLAAPRAAEFAALRRRSGALGNWPATFERLLLQLSRRSGLEPASGLRTPLLLAEGREHELVDAPAAKREMSFEEIKLLAKYAVARLCGGVDLTPFKKLQELGRRLAKDRDDASDWLRLGVEKPGTLSRAEYARLACRMYRKLVDLHLGSAKPSRAAPAAHYCAIVSEVSRLVGDPALWADLLGHLTRAHGRKRLIWQRLRAEGCPVS